MVNVALCWEDGVEGKGGLACSHNTTRISFQREHMMLQYRSGQPGILLGFSLN